LDPFIVYLQFYTDALKYAVAGIISEIISNGFVVPFDVVAQRLMVQGEGKSSFQYNGSLDAVRQIFRKEGVRGFYKVSIQYCVIMMLIPTELLLGIWSHNANKYSRCSSMVEFLCIRER
jgi:hypothetical protein